MDKMDAILKHCRGKKLIDIECIEADCQRYYYMHDTQRTQLS
jgi:hypothetical protein